MFRKDCYFFGEFVDLNGLGLDNREELFKKKCFYSIAFWERVLKRNAGASLICLPDLGSLFIQYKFSSRNSLNF